MRSRRVVGLVAMGVVVLRLVPTFVAPPPEHEQVASRRAIVAALMSAATLQLAEQAAVAAEAPVNIEAVGFPDGIKNANGVYTIVSGKEINKRAVYKRDGEKIFLNFNDCGQFQLTNNPTAECKGFALEEKGKWFYKGEEVKGVKLRPIKKSEDGKTSTPVALPSSPVQLPSLPELPQLGFSGKESDSDLLFGKASNGINVGNYIKAKGGTSFLENAMKMDDEETKISDSLEARLFKKK